MFLADQEAQKHLGTQTKVENMPKWVWGSRQGMDWNFNLRKCPGLVSSPKHTHPKESFPKAQGGKEVPILPSPSPEKRALCV